MRRDNHDGFYYGLPQTWPGRLQSRNAIGAVEKALCVENAVRNDVVEELGASFNAERFVPFVVMHEFEGLLFSDCAAFSRGIGRSDLESRLQEIRDKFATPEQIMIRQPQRLLNAYKISCRDTRSLCSVYLLLSRLA